MLETWTKWDGRTVRRALSVSAVALLVAWLVTAATDEGNISWPERAGRALPVAPVCAALGAWLALAPSRARGELRALASLGRSPWENSRAAVMGGAAIATIAGAAIAWVPRLDAAGFYPEVGLTAELSFDGTAFLDRDNGWRIAADGALLRSDVLPTTRESRIPPHGRAVAGLATAVIGLALALVVARSERRGLWLLASILGGAVTLLLFQAAGARRLGASWALLPPLFLLVMAASRYRDTWPHMKSRQGPGGR
jgi:hypothetical protein